MRAAQLFLPSLFLIAFVPPAPQILLELTAPTASAAPATAAAQSSSSSGGGGAPLVDALSEAPLPKSVQSLLQKAAARSRSESPVMALPTDANMYVDPLALYVDPLTAVGSQVAALCAWPRPPTTHHPPTTNHQPLDAGVVKRATPCKDGASTVIGTVVHALGGSPGGVWCGVVWQARSCGVRGRRRRRWLWFARGQRALGGRRRVGGP